MISKSKLVFLMLIGLLSTTLLSQDRAYGQSSFPLGSPPSSEELAKAQEGTEIEKADENSIADQEKVATDDTTDTSVNQAESVASEEAILTSQTAEAVAIITLGSDGSEPRTEPTWDDVPTPIVNTPELAPPAQAEATARIVESSVSPTQSAMTDRGHAFYDPINQARDHCELEVTPLDANGRLGLRVRVPDSIELVEVIPTGDPRSLKLQLGMDRQPAQSSLARLSFPPRNAIHNTPSAQVRPSTSQSATSQQRVANSQSPFKPNPFYQGRGLEPIYSTAKVDPVATAEKSSATHEPLPQRPSLLQPQRAPLLPVKNEASSTPASQPSADAKQESGKVRSLNSVLETSQIRKDGTSRSNRAQDILAVNAEIPVAPQKAFARQLIHNAPTLKFEDKAEITLAGPNSIALGDFGDFVIQVRNLTGTELESCTIQLAVGDDLRIDVIDRKAVFDSINNRLTFSIPQIQAGGQASIKYRATAEKAGIQKQRVRAFTDNGNAIQTSLISDVVLMRGTAEAPLPMQIR